MEWWSSLSGSDRAAWLSAIATAMATIAAICSLVVTVVTAKLASDAGRWNRFDRRAPIHWLTHVYLREVLAAGFKIDAPLTSEWWRDIWLHRFLFKDDVRMFLDRIFESGAALENLKDAFVDAD